MSEEARKAALDRLFAEAIRLRNQEEPEAALTKLDEYDQIAAGSTIAGDVIRCGICWEIGRLDDALCAAQRVLRREPRHAIASRVLVHTLVELERFDAARAEAERYLRDVVESVDGRRVPETLKVFYRDIVTATLPELDAIAESSRRKRIRGRLPEFPPASDIRARPKDS